MKYTESEKAFWILENGPLDHIWMFERNGDIIYRRAALGPSGKLAPWIPKEREEISNKIVGREANSVWIDEIGD